MSLDDAYDVNILASGTDSIADLDANPIYTSFDGAGGNGIIGTLELDCNTAIDIDLNGTAVDCNNDINAITATLSGDVSAFTAGVDVAGVTGTNNVAEDESTADLSGLLASAGFGPTNIELNEDGDVINRPTTRSPCLSTWLLASLTSRPSTARSTPSFAKARLLWFRGSLRLLSLPRTTPPTCSASATSPAPTLASSLKC